MLDTHQEDRTPEEWRGPLLEAVVAHVPFDGWTMKALFAAADDLDVSHGVAELAFMGGAEDMIEAYLERADRKMLDALDSMDIANMGIRDKITAAIRARISAAEHEKETVKHTISALAVPGRQGLGARRLWHTADLIWRAVGDTSTDLNWYSKRTVLAGVYSSTLLYWVQDESESHLDTWAFLDRRIADVMKIEKAKADWREFKTKLPDPTTLLSRLRYPAP